MGEYIELTTHHRKPAHTSLVPFQKNYEYISSICTKNTVYQAYISLREKGEEENKQTHIHLVFHVVTWSIVIPLAMQFV